MASLNLLLPLLLFQLCLSSCTPLLQQQLEQYLDAQKAQLYAQLLTDAGISVDSHVSYANLHDLGITQLHDQLQVMRALRQQEASHTQLPERLIFCVNTGRSGSRYLASLLDSCEGVLAEHEPRPGAGGARNMMHERLDSSFEQRRKLKISAIRRSMVSQRATDKGAIIYAETNPNFKVWIWDIALYEFAELERKRVDIMIVRKYIPALVKSIYELGWFQHGNKGEGWLPTANSVNSLIQPLAPDSELDAYDKIISSIINTEAVAQHIMETYGNPSSSNYLPNVRFHEYRSEELFDGGRVLQVLQDDLQLQPTEVTGHLAGVTIDKYRTGSDHSGSLRSVAQVRHTTLQECEQRVTDYIRRCEARGIWLPDLPHLSKYPGFVYH